MTTNGPSRIRHPAMTNPMSAEAAFYYYITVNYHNNSQSWR